ncbi:MAG: ThuA domain-containing protein [Lewinellaceae bacterium]|nr:ThuA domain-containing protein [Lewinellaceae bacterium]
MTFFLRNRLCFFLALALTAQMNAQEKAVLTFVASAGDFDRFDSPVSASLEDVPIAGPDMGFRMAEQTPGGEVPVDFQFDGNRIWWQLSGETPAGADRIYRLYRTDGAPKAPAGNLTVSREDGAILFQKGKKNILRYQYKEEMPPAGKSPLYRRGGFIHPLWSPGGEVLTRIQPPDHTHHYGIWNPWTHTTFEGRHLDFWNLNEGQATVRVVGLPVFQQGAVFGEMSARHEHVDLTAPAPEGYKAALEEGWKIRVWNAGSEKGPWVVDFTSTLNCATDSALTIDAYRYQGFGYRGTEKWDDQTARLLTSEGKDKSDGNGTRARWIDVRGDSGPGKSGILFMTNPQNHNFPEQLRIWPTGTNKGQENVFINFNPAQEQDWVLHPGKTYTLNYRMLVYDGTPSPELMDKYWQDYAHPIEARVALNQSGGPKRVLVYTRNGKGYIHENRAASVEAIKKLGAENGFIVDATEDPAFITEENLKKYQAVICSNTNNETFDTEAGKLAFQRYIQAGGGFVGIHSASGSERQWPWFWSLLGGKFRRHPPLQSFDVKVIDPTHPSTLHLGKIWKWEDECYYLEQFNPGNHVLLAADLTTVEDDKKAEYPGVIFGNYIPLAWCRDNGPGRAWYTALGHKPEYYADPNYLKHLLGGILWVLDGTDRLDYSRATAVLMND